MRRDMLALHDYIRPIGIRRERGLIRFAGTGFGFREPGLVLTAAHVVAAATEARSVLLRLRDGTFLQATTIAVHPTADVAALRFEPGQTLRTFQLAEPPAGLTDHHLGTEVGSYGYPYRQEGPNRITLEPRLLTGDIQRCFQYEQGNRRYHAYETSFPVTPGQSGSPAFLTNRVTSVVGVLTTNFQSSTIIDEYEEHVEEGQRELHRITKVVSYGIAAALAPLADWIRQS